MQRQGTKWPGAAAAIAATGLALAFVVWLAVVGDETLAAIDRAGVLAFRTPEGALRGGWRAEQALIDLTALGGWTVLTLVSVFAVALFLRAGRRREAVAAALALPVSAALAEGLKALIARPRPDLVAHLGHANGWSFPSGHALESAAVWLTLAGLCSRAAPRLSPALMIAAVGLSLAVAASRVALGVHWPTDVVAGWLMGAAVAACALAVAGPALNTPRR
ncbi:MAG: phosphatase PAP2 family protein [Parvularculaceae bacterium]|nr:phosphatase PAP2 family protein [Parvularculaceae bacterium]